MKRLNPLPSLGDRVYLTLRDEICDGTIAPGMHLVQEELARKLGVSRQPIQQAMALLRSDGLVQEQTGRGLCVAPLDTSIMRQHYEIRSALDALAARRAAGRAAASPAVAGEIRRGGETLIEAGRAAAASGSVKRLVRCDVDFHRFVYEESGNPLLGETAEPHWVYLRRVMAEVLRRAAPGPEIWLQHEEILAAIVRGDETGAAALAQSHVEGAADRLSAALAADDGSATRN
jgi:DNA-binding GntR family transcriptional regulator